MFTGLVEKTAQVTSMQISPNGLLRLSDNQWDYTLGESIAINGCCLTVSSIDEGCPSFDISSESFSCTNLGQLRVGSMVNLERAMLASQRFGGHMVSGHVDTTASVLRVGKHEHEWEVDILLDAKHQHLIVDKGSICVDGVSLTVNNVSKEQGQLKVSLLLIPTTVEHTCFKELQLDQILNIEFDLIGKYIAQWSEPYLRQIKR